MSKNRRKRKKSQPRLFRGGANRTRSTALDYGGRGRCELLESFDFGYPQMSGTKYAWPVIDVHIRYIKPAVFGQEIKVIATLGEIEHRLKINYLIEDANTGERLTKGHTIQVAVNMQTREMCLVSPSVLYERLGIER